MSLQVPCPLRWAMPVTSRLLLPLCLSLLLVPWAPGCLFCFSTPQQRLRVCQVFLGHASSRHTACLGTLQAAFQPHTQLVVGAVELEKLKDTFSNVIFSLEEKGVAKVPYQVAFPEVAARIQPELAQLKPGYQKDAQVYRCSSCSTVECQLPLDCPEHLHHYPCLDSPHPCFALPVEDVWKAEGNRTALRCRVPFQTSPEVRIGWRFAKDLRTRDLSLFRDLRQGASSLILHPTRVSHRGTYVCQLTEEDDVVARKYFYLNVTSSSQGAETDLQNMFLAILRSPGGRGAGGPEGHFPRLPELLAEPDSLHKRNVVLLMVGLALSAMLGTLLLGGVFRRAMAWPR
ncbi:sperm acrosome membrane-associated protein 6 isoform X2 [Pelodiscus sinensis]|uniref:sperm acrosome membrane-associated protein 6 isoform X2 n=1 Tax=Pelodiscus sinensis TaxID=13735 RepID=UPI003F6B31E9